MGLRGVKVIHLEGKKEEEMHKFTHTAHTLTCDLKGQFNKKKDQSFLSCPYQAIWIVLVWFANAGRFMLILA